MTYLFNKEVGFVPNAIDAFNRLKVSQPFTLFDSQHRYRENEKWNTGLSGGGTYSYKIDESAIEIAVSAATGDHVYRETRNAFPYQPGKSLLVLNSFVFAQPKDGLRQRIGYFSTLNGVFLEHDGNTAYFVLRSGTSGSASDARKIPQSDWNADTFDGNGPSGRDLDLSKSNILWTDIEWLGVGDVRCGFFIDGKPVLAHTFHNDNIQTTAYMTTACLPLRFELENLKNTGSGSTARQICNSVMSEAGYEGFSRQFNISRGVTTASLTTGGTYYPLASIRMKSDRTDSVVIPSGLDLVVTSNTWIHFKVLLNPVLTGANWTTHSNGTVEYDLSASAVSGGTEIVGGYVNQGGQVRLSGENQFHFQLGRSLTGASDIFTIVASSGGNNVNVLADLSWYELT